MRGVIAEYTAQQVYSTARQEIQDKICENAVERLGHKMMEAETPDEARASNAPNNVSMEDMVILYDTLLYGIELPASVVQAINRKTEQYYIAQEYEFRINRERKELERKAIEAEGIHEFQQIVSQGISNSYLRWRGVEATLQLAQSNNSKVVIIGGGGKDGLPIILGNVDTPAPAPARGTSPAENGAMAEERITAAAPAVPLEKTPAADLAMPAEKMPAAELGHVAGEDAGCRSGYAVHRRAGRTGRLIPAQLVLSRGPPFTGPEFDGGEDRTLHKVAVRPVGCGAAAIASALHPGLEGQSHLMEMGRSFGAEPRGARK